jgi:hypothetical protein
VVDFDGGEDARRDLGLMARTVEEEVAHVDPTQLAACHAGRIT